MIIPTLEQLIKFRVINSLGHWYWNGSYSHNRPIYRGIYVSRWVCHLFHGMNLYDSSVWACHKNECHDQKCWNPDHLYVGNATKNAQDTHALLIPKLQTHCSRGHVLDKESRGIDWRGRNYCKHCRRITSDANYQLRREKVAKRKQEQETSNLEATREVKGV